MEQHDEDIELRELITRYIQKELSVEDVQAFEAKLLMDAHLRQEVELMKNIYAGLNRWGEHELRSAIQEVDMQLESEHFFGEISKSPINEPSATQPKVFVLQKHLFYRIGIAAGIAAAVIFGYFLFRHKTPDAATLYTKYYHPEKELTGSFIKKYSTGGFLPGQVAEDSLVWAMEQYEAGNYASAADYLKRTITDSTQHDLRLYFYGLCLMELDQPVEAGIFLQEVCNKDNIDIKATACWYYGLSELEAHGLQPECFEIFRNIANDAHSTYRIKAQELLKELNL